ncbi:MAG: isoleucine--tRNA ligase [Candidatus Doudnabacteria bacterium]
MGKILFLLNGDCRVVPRGLGTPRNDEKMKFKKAPPKPNFPELEKKILEYWEKNKIFEKSLKKPSPEGDFVFYEGPPTANGKPGAHHVEARAFKDLFPRYKTMQGYRVERKAGWDTHGLPVELEVEKSLGFSGKRDIEKYGIEKFNKKCAASVWKYKEEWEKLTKRMGYWVDLEHPYVTCSNEYIESVWFILKKIWEKGLLYQGHKVVPYCPRCGTALSSHEVCQGYKKVKEESVFVKFKIRTPLNLPLERGEKSLPLLASLTLRRSGPEERRREGVGAALPLPEGEMPACHCEARAGREGAGVYFLAWTTTPWTLPGNVALALGGEIEYVLIKRKVKSEKRKTKNQETPLTPLVRGGDKEEYLILAEERLEVLEGEYKMIKKFKGKDLAGIEYEPLYPVFINYKCHAEFSSASKKSSQEILKQVQDDNFSLVYRTVLADFVTTEEGTGIVHTAVMYGEDDYALGKKLGLPMRHTVDEQGKFKFDFFKKGMDSSSPDKGRAGGVLEKEKETPLKSPLVRGEGGIEGVFVKDAEKDIVDDLRKRDLLYKSESYEHDYPFCWRCKTPLLYYAKKSWFIAMSKLRDKLVENNEKINWIPKYLKTGRFGKWIAEAKDWAVSRERYWGTPLPVWICGKCGEVKVIGSREEFYSVIASGAKQSPASKTEARNVGTLSLLNGDCRVVPRGLGTPRNDDIAMDLHRPYIDAIKFKCSCGGEMRRVPEVLDCWFDSGAMPFAQNHWPFAGNCGLRIADCGLNTKNPPELFPADFICEAVDQTRGWFYTLLAISTLLDFGSPYKNVISLGHVLDKNGQKMSKSRGNIVDPFKALDEFSADSIRWFFYTVNRPQESKNFDPAILRDIVSRFILTLWNSYSFFLTYASIDQPNVGADPCVCPKIDLCVNPQESGGHKGSLNGRTHWSEIGRTHGSAIGRTHWSAPTGNILDRWILSRLAELNNNIVQCLNRYDVLKAAKEIEQFVDDLSNWYIRRSRRRFWKSENDQDKDQGYNTLHSVLVLLCEMLAPFMPFLTENIYRNLTGKESVHLAKFPKISSEGIDQDILEQMDITRKIVTLGLNLRAQAKIKVRQPIASLKIKNQKSRLRRGFGGQAKIKETMQNLKLLDLMREELNVKKIELTNEIQEEENWMIGEEDGIKVALNTEITPELKREGIIRDLVRAVQEMRKKAGLEVSDRIELSLYSEDKEIQKAIQEWQDYIQKETLAERIQTLLLSGSPTEKSGARVKIEGKEVRISIRNCSNYSN